MGLPPSRSLKLLLPRLAEEPPLRDGLSLPGRSARIRIGPLLQREQQRVRDSIEKLPFNYWTATSLILLSQKIF